MATVRQGKIVISEELELPEGTKVLVTVLPEEETEFWNGAGKKSLDQVWDNSADEIYAELLK